MESKLKINSNFSSTYFFWTARGTLRFIKITFRFHCFSSILEVVEKTMKNHFFIVFWGFFCLLLLSSFKGCLWPHWHLRTYGRLPPCGRLPPNIRSILDQFFLWICCTESLSIIFIVPLAVPGLKSFSILLYLKAKIVHFDHSVWNVQHFDCF